MSCNRFSLQKNNKTKQKQLSQKFISNLFLSLAKFQNLYYKSIVSACKVVRHNYWPKSEKKQRYYHEIVSLQIVDTDYLAQFGLLEKINFDG